MKKRKKLLVIVPLCMVLLCAAAVGVFYASERAGGMYNAFVKIDRTDMMQAAAYEDSNGIAMPYRVYVPENPGTGEPYPLVLYLHGAGARGDDNHAQAKRNSVMQTLLNRENLAKYPCVVLAPQCPMERWWDEPEITAALMGLLEQVRAAYPVDSARVYITGLSMGGYGTWGMLAAWPDYFAAAVPICGGGEPNSVALFKDVPIWTFHGARDGTVPVQQSRDMVEALEAVGGNVKYTEYPGERHACWEVAYREPDLFPWLFEQFKSEAPPVDPIDMMTAEKYENLPYRIYVPEDTGEKQYPLVLCLHGSGNRGDDNLAQLGRSSAVHTLLAPDHLVKYPCIVLAPQCPEGQRWIRGIGQYDLPGNTEALMGLLEQIKANYPVDPARIYITGLSMGGFGTWGMLKTYPDYFAAAVPICGGWNLEEDVENAPKLKDIPIWAFHGALDDDVPAERSRDMVQALEAVNGNVKYTEYPDGGHAIWDRVYNEPELLPWLFAQKNEGGAS